MTEISFVPSRAGDAEDYITTYTMDLVSNRLAKQTDNAATARAITDFVTLGSSMTADEVVTYSYDGNDRMQWEKKDAAGTAEDTYTTYAWNAGDQVGKTTRAGLTDQGAVTETTTFEYNVQGRTGKITTVKAGQTTEITYKYNLQGIRVEEATTAGGVTTTKSYLIDQANFTGYAQVLEEYVDGQLAKTFTLGHDMLTQHDPANGALTFIYDGHGSTRALLNPSASVIQRYAYEAYGQMLDGQRNETGTRTVIFNRNETGTRRRVQFTQFFDISPIWHPHRSLFFDRPSRRTVNSKPCSVSPYGRSPRSLVSSRSDSRG